MFPTWQSSRVRHLDGLIMEEGDLTDQASLIRVLGRSQPDEVYNPGVTRMLEAVRTVNPAVRFYQAFSSELFGQVQAVS